MPDRAAVEAFVDEYRRTFQSFDADSIARLFAYPVHVASEAGDVSVASVPSMDLWLPQLERIVSAYRMLGVRSASVVSLRAVEVTARIAHAVVQWSLTREDGSVVYDFTASYTIVDLADGLRVAAIAHDETPKLVAAVARAKDG